MAQIIPENTLDKIESNRDTPKENSDFLNVMLEENKVVQQNHFVDVMEVESSLNAIKISQGLESIALNSNLNCTSARAHTGNRGRPKKLQNRAAPHALEVDLDYNREEEVETTWNVARRLGVTSFKEQEVLEELRRSKRIDKQIGVSPA